MVRRRGRRYPLIGAFGERLQRLWHEEAGGSEDGRPRFIAEAHLIGGAAALGMGSAYLVMGLPVAASLAFTISLALGAFSVLLRRGAAQRLQAVAPPDPGPAQLTATTR